MNESDEYMKITETKTKCCEERTENHQYLNIFLLQSYDKFSFDKLCIAVI
jgi:hypothetical protein